MHIAFLTPEYIHLSRYDGGLANYVRKVGLELIARGHRVSIFVLSSRQVTWNDEGLFIYEVKRFTLPSWLKKFRPLQPFLPVFAQVINARWLSHSAWRLHKINPINIFQASSYTAPGLALRRNGHIPLISRVSSYTPLLRSASGRTRSFSEYLCDWLEIRQIQESDAVFAPSHFIANIYKRLENIQPIVLRTPVDFQTINPDNTFYNEYLSGKQYLLYFGTLSPIKGVDLISTVMPSILDKWVDLYFAFIGRDDGLPGGPKMYENLYSHGPKYSQRLFYHPAIPKAQIYPVVQHALGVLLPSRIDNYPNACLEAQSFGVPVIGTDNSSLEEMITDKETGFLARNGDPKSLQDAIEHLLKLTTEERLVMKSKLLEATHLIQSEDRVGQLVTFYEQVVNSLKKITS